MSKDLESWLVNEVGISSNKVIQLYNGVNTERFHPAADDKLQRSNMPIDFANADSIVIGTVGRLEPVKDQVTLVKAFINLLETHPQGREHLRLVIIGNGTLKPEIENLLVSADASKLVWLAGSRNDVADILRELDIFVLPSLAEGISNTILEAMASALPVVATNVGGNSELIQNGVTGILVPPANPVAMSRALQSYIDKPADRYKQGQAGRDQCVEVFSLAAMMRCYQQVYDDLLLAKGFVKE